MISSSTIFTPYRHFEYKLSDTVSIIDMAMRAVDIWEIIAMLSPTHIINAEGLGDFGYTKLGPNRIRLRTNNA